MGATGRFRRRCSTSRRTLDTIDVRGTVHGDAIDTITADDRRWFEDHPGEQYRYRAAGEHEFCNPARYPLCELPFATPPRLVPSLVPVLWVQVTRITDGMRTREPYWVLEPTEIAS